LREDIDLAYSDISNYVSDLHVSTSNTSD
jgi:hypothetical protein